MKKLLSFFIIIYLVLGQVIPPSIAMEKLSSDATTSVTTVTPPAISSETAIVMDANTGQILYEKNAYQTMYPASITKILTTLVAIEQGDLDSTITMTDEAVWGIDWDSNHIGLQIGEQITLRDALYASMLQSANEAAWGVAIHVSGSLSAFCDAMNARAKELGCTNTHFSNANGLHNDDHYTTAYDMALITKAALENPEFVEIASTPNYTIPPTNMTADSRYLSQSNRMVQSDSEYYYEYCLGGKTGFTQMALGTLVTWAKKDGVTLICVTMKTLSNADNYTDSIALFNYCFDNYTAHYLTANHQFTETDIKAAEKHLNSYYGGKNLGTLQIAVAPDSYYLTPNNVSLGELSYNYIMSTNYLDQGILGNMEVKDGSTTLASIPITYSGYINSEDEEAVQAAIAAGIIEAPPKEKDKKGFPTFLIIIITIIAVAVIAFYLRYMQIQKMRKAYKKKRDLARKSGRSF